MASGQELIIMLLMLLFGNEGGNEALDYVDSKTYWQHQGIEMQVESLLKEIDTPSLDKDAPPKAAEIRKLLAIRSLGELKSKKALGSLLKLAESRELFVSDYAKEAIATINGEKAPTHAFDQKSFSADTHFFPKDTGVIAQLKMANGAAVDIEPIVTMLSEDMSVQELNQAINQLQHPLIKFLELTGNIRLDGITLAVADKVNNDSGWIAISMRGQYDSTALKATFNDLTSEPADVLKSEGREYFVIDNNALLSFVSDSQCLFLAGPSLDNLPYQQLSKNGQPKAAYSKDLQAQIKSTDTSGPLWIAGLVTGDMQQIPHLSDCQSFSLETSNTRDLMNFTLTGVMKNEALAQSTSDALEEIYGEFLEQQLPQLKEMQVEVKEMEYLFDFFEAVQFRTRGKNCIIHSQIKQMNPLMILGALFFGVSNDGPAAERGDAVEVIPVPQ